MKKILYIIICSILLVFSYLLILLNCKAFNFPEWVVLIFGIISIVGLAGYFVLFKTKLAAKIVLPIVFVVFTIFSTMFAYCYPYWNSYSTKRYNGIKMNYDEVITYKEAKKDLDYAISYVSNVHPLFKKGAPEVVKTRYDESVNRLKNDSSITVNELRKEIQYILSSIHDAHTTTYNNFPDDKFLIKSLKLVSEGYSISIVNGMTAQEINDMAKEYYCYEVEEWISVDVGSLASLEFYGFDIDPLTIVWENDEGETITEDYTVDDFVTYDKFLDEYNKYFESNTKSFVYYDIYDNYAVLTLQSCDYNGEYRKCVKDFFTEVKNKGIKNVAVDVRGNGGGNSTVVNEFLKYLPVEQYKDCIGTQRWGIFNVSFSPSTKNKQYKNLLFDGNVYIITNRKSFSSAMDFAQVIQDNKIGYVIGEASANATDSYGDVAGFRLPSTGMYLQISTKKWERIDPARGRIVVPDYPCSSADSLSTLKSIIE